MHWWEHTVEIFCQNFFLSRWSERLQTICVRVALQLLQLLHLQDFCLSATQWDKTFPDNSYSSGNMHVHFFLVNISTRHQAVASPNIFPSHSEWWDWPGRSRAVKMQKPREIVERTTVSVWRLEIFAVASCQEMSRIATAFALGWTLEYSEGNTKTPAELYQDHFKLTLDCPAQLSRISSTSFCTFKVVSSRTRGNNSCHQNLMIIIALANLVSRLKVGRRCLSGVTLWPSAVTTWKLCWKNMDETSVWCSAVILEVFRKRRRRRRKRSLAAPV